MNVITIESSAFQEIKDKLDAISKALNGKENKSKDQISGKWYTIDQTCQVLNVSRRTLQAYRDDGIISFSQYQGKIYFKTSDIEAHLQKNYKPAFNNKKQ